jgi:hypothetical protein
MDGKIEGKISLLVTLFLALAILAPWERMQPVSFINLAILFCTFIFILFSAAAVLLPLSIIGFSEKLGDTEKSSAMTAWVLLLLCWMTWPSIWAYIGFVGAMILLALIPISIWEERKNAKRDCT